MAQQDAIAPSMGESMSSSGNIIESASGGVALRAIRVDGGSRKWAAKQVLQCPRECRLQGPVHATSHFRLEFSTYEKSCLFCEAVSNLGWNAALNLFPPAAKMQLNHAASQAASSCRSSEGDSNCKVEVHYLPVKSFSIKRSCMRLSEEALSDLRAVNSHQQALKFLSQYHSHVSTGTHHLGAMRFSWLAAQSQAHKTHRGWKHRTKLKTDAGLPVVAPSAAPSPLQAIIGVGLQKGAQSADLKGAFKQETTSYTAVQSIGGAVSAIHDINAFIKATEARPSSWAIIDSDLTGIHNLVPIWDLALQTGEEHLKNPADLLRATWQSSVASLVQKDQDLYELHQASIASIIQANDETSNTLGKVITALQALEENPEMIYEDFPTLWVSLPHEQRPQLVRNSAFTRFLRATRDEMQPAATKMLLNILQSLPDVDSMEILSKAGVTLEIQLRPQQLDQPQFVQLVQAQKISPEELPDKLFEVISFNNAKPPCSVQADCLETSDSLTVAQQDTICKLLKKCITDANGHHALPAILKTISNFGFQCNNEITYLYRPSRQVLQAMIEELRLTTVAPSVMAGQQQSDDMQHGSPMDDSKILKVAGEDNGDDKEKKGFNFTFIDDFLTHGPFPRKDKFKNLIDRISHGLIPFQDSHHKVRSKEDFWDDVNIEGDVFDTRSVANDQEGSATEEADAVKSLVQIYKNSDAPAKIALLRLLLDQRWGVPIVYGSTGTSRNLQCFHTLEALDCVLTTVQTESSNFDLLQDTYLPRVVFLSSHQSSEHEHMAKEVTKFRFLPFHCISKNCTPPLKNRIFQGLKAYLGNEKQISEALDECHLYVQLGMGFLKIQNSVSFSASPVYKPYVAIVVSGTSTEIACMKFLNEVADMLILQVESYDTGHNSVVTLPYLTGKSVLRWAISSSGAHGENRANKEIWGSAKHVAEEITRLIHAKLVGGGQINNKQEGRKNLRNIIITHFPSQVLMDQEEGLEDAISQTNFRTLKEQLTLQISFLIEAIARFESLSLKHDKGQKQLKLTECNKQREKRKENIKNISKIPILQYFLSVLRKTEQADRSTCMIKLQNLMQEKSQKALEELNQKVLQAFETLENTGTEEAAAEYNDCKKTYTEKEVGTVHLWREVCHMFLTNPDNYSELPKLAARHLLDGFPLEILDGDAKDFSEPWVTTVLQEAEELINFNLRSVPRILVLSVLGTQSSGKSTLLNVMFGTQLPTKAGRCTRGVHIQLVRSGWPQYDYILLMDTEGIRCPENFGGEQHLSHDNRLATFAILPADACIMVVANEEDRSLKEVLPIVLLAFKGSAAAEKSGGRLRSKLSFVYRSVNINEQSDLWCNQQKLVEDLVEAERQIRKPKSSRSQNENDGAKQETDTIAQRSLLTARESETIKKCGQLKRLFEFHVDVDEAFSDIKFLGNYKRNSKPPEDFPDSQFGEKVLQLRDYLHKRVTESSEWKPFDLREFGSYMNLVWRCILDADFELSFADAVQYHTFLELQESLKEARLSVSRAYVQEMEELEKRSQDWELSAPQTTVNNWGKLRFDTVNTTIQNERIRVEKTLQSQRYLKWKAEEHQNWEGFLCQQDVWFNMQLNDYRIGVVLLDKLVNECNQRLLQEIIAARNHCKPIPFENLFSEILSYAQDQHKPLARRVPMLVNEVYNRHKDIDEYISFEEGEDPDNRKQLADECLSELIQKYVAPSLKVARQYSDDLVEEAINLTNTFIERHPFFYNNNCRFRTAYTHAGVKLFAIEELSKIQQSWDEQHNPAERLKKQKNQFQLFYNNHMSRYDRTDLLREDLKSVFGETLESTLQNSVVKGLSNSLKKAPWLSNWRVMRNLLDAFLLKLLDEWEGAIRKQNGKEAERKVVTLIDFVSDDALFHRIVVEELIKKTIHEAASDLLHNFHRKINHAVSYANTCATTAADRGKLDVTKIFLDKLAEALSSDLPECRKTWMALKQISRWAYTAGEGRIEFDSIVLPGLHGVVDEICDKFVLSIPTKLRDFIDGVASSLQSHDNETFRLRCTEKCPLCGATCFLPAFHKESHDTLHQPQGLKGTIWEHNGELSEKSCSAHLRDGDDFILPEDQQQGRTGSCRASYEHFEEVFPAWRKPVTGYDAMNPHTCRVRQCIFFHCQAELVKRFPRACVNNQIAHFAHPIAVLRFQLDQDLPEDLRRFKAETDLSDLPV